MSAARFFGKWPTDAAGNPITVTIAAYPYNGEPHKLALTRAGKNPNQKSKAEKPLSALTPDSQIGPVSTNSTSRRGNPR